MLALNSTSDRCSAAWDYCRTEEPYVNFFVAHYCILREVPFLSSIIAVIILIVFFDLISYLGEDYISRAVAKLTTYMKITEATAGKTILALANGAADVITAMLASANSRSVSHLAIGGLLGGHLFGVTLVLGSVILYSSNKMIGGLSNSKIEMDICFFIGSIALVILFGFLEVSSYILGGCLLLIYFSYLIVVLVLNAPKTESNKLRQSNDGSDPRGMLRSNIPSYFEKESLLSDDEQNYIEEDHFQEILLKLKKRAYKDWKSSMIIYKIIYFMGMPFKLLIQLTVPPVATPLLNPYQKFIYPFTTTFFLLFNHDLLFVELNLLAFKLPMWLLGLVLACIATIVLCMFYKASEDNAYKPTPRFFFNLLAILGSVSWLSFIISIVISIVTFLGFLSGLPKIFFGVFVLACGNSFTGRL